LPLIQELKRRNVIRVGIAYVAFSWLLIQVIETVFPAFGLSETAFRSVVIALAVGLLPVLIFAWAFELTPEGLKKEKDVDRAASMTPKTGKTLDRAIMVLLALAVTFFAVDKFVIDPQRDAERIESAAEAAVEQAFAEAEAALPERSIAVLPFDDLSAAGDQEYFSDGLAEEVLNLLVKIPELRVISRYSAFSYKNKGLDIATIASELRVRHILQGSVRRDGDNVRITAQLIDTRDDSHIWSDTYDRSMQNIFGVQDEISLMVVNQLRVTLLNELPKARITDPVAYDLFLQGRHFGRQAAFEESLELLERSLELDPDYVPARMEIARNYMNMAGRAGYPRAEGYENARKAATNALAVDPDCANCFNSLGWIAARWDHDLATAARHYQRAIELDPTSLSIINGVSALLGNLGRQEDGLQLAEYVVDREPLHASLRANLGANYAAVGRFEDAIESYQAAIRLYPGYPGAHGAVGEFLAFLGDPEAGIEFSVKEPSPAWRAISEAIVYHALGQIEEADAALNGLIEEHSQDSAYNIAYVYAMRNDADKAFEWLDKAVEYKDPGLSEILGKPHFANIHDDPRWIPLLESIGKTEAQLASIKLDFQLPGT